MVAWNPDEEVRQLEALDLEELSEQLRRHELAIEAALERDHVPATWTIPDDSYRDGGKPYTEEELEELRNPEGETDV
jgi:hypothetical protein